MVVDKHLALLRCR